MLEKSFLFFGTHQAKLKYPQISVRNICVDLHIFLGMKVSDSSSAFDDSFLAFPDILLVFLCSI